MVIKKGDNIIYCPPYVTFYSERYEGVVLSVSKDGEKANCQLGFGKKLCLIKDIVKIKSSETKPQ